MKDIARELKEWLDDVAYSYMSAWEHDPHTVIKDNAITGRDPDREDHESRMVVMLEGLRDGVSDVPSELLRETDTLRSRSPDRFEKVLRALIPYVGSDHFRPETATQFVQKLNEFARQP